MAKAWRTVLLAVLVLLAAGVVLMGAAWLTGASVPRIVELVFGGQAGLDAWAQSALRRVQAIWTGVIEQIESFF